MEDDPRLAILVLNWNRRDDTLACLDSLAASDYPHADVIVIDNASTDDSVAAIRQRFPAIRVVENDQNLGYAGGNNVGLQLAMDERFDAVMILNNDTTVAPDAVARMVRVLRSDPRIGIVSPVIYYRDEPELIWSAGGEIDWRRGEAPSTFTDSRVTALPDAVYDIEHVSGCCMLVRADAIRSAGMIDKRFFMYYEETEWCVRIARAGYRIVVEPDASIWHAIQPDEQLGSTTVAYYMTRNRLLLLLATNAPVSAWAHTLFEQIRTVAALWIRPASPERAKGRVPMVRALRDFALGRFGPAPVRR